MLKYTGYIRKIRYYSESSHYIVALLEVEEDQELLTMNGYMSNFNDYDKYAFYFAYKWFRQSACRVLHFRFHSP